MIAIRNIYYMLSYAFAVLREQGYQEMETEEFENGQELCAAILIRGISMQIRRGTGAGLSPGDGDAKYPERKDHAVGICEKRRHFSAAAGLYG